MTMHPALSLNQAETGECAHFHSITGYACISQDLIGEKMKGIE